MKILKYADVVVVFLLFLLFFHQIIPYGGWDYRNHADYILQLKLNEASYLPNFLFHYITQWLSMPDILSVKKTIAVLLSLAISAKYLITKCFLSDEFAKVTWWVLITISFSLLISFSIPDHYSYFALKKWYLVRFAPTVWHNSTTIFLFPFSLLLFYVQLAVFRQSRLRIDLIVAIYFLVIVNLLIKPSFIFAYVPATALIICYQYLKVKIEAKEFITYFSPIVIALLVVFLQYFFLYESDIDNTSSGIDVSPFKLIRYNMPIWYIPISFIFSYLLPLYVSLVYRDIWRNFAFIYACLLVFFALFVASIFVETGVRQFHGNFFWQVYICGYILQIVTILFLLKKTKQEVKLSMKMLGAWGVFLLQIISGVIYIVKFLITGSYY